MKNDELPDVAELLPQGPAFRFIDTIVDVAAERAKAQQNIP